MGQDVLVLWRIDFSANCECSLMLGQHDTKVSVIVVHFHTLVIQIIFCLQVSLHIPKH